MRIGIANDMVLAAEALRRAIARNGRHEVVWIVHNGNDAVTRCKQDRPDLLLMDLFMPQLDGVEATRRIMHQSPCAIMIATSSVENHKGKVFEAMSAGAIDAVDIPTLTDTENPDLLRPFFAKIETINKLVTPHQRQANSSTETKPPSNLRAERLVAIGSSAGGPSALTTILAALPVDFPASVIIVQHVDKQFAEGLTGWFATHTKLQVRVAAEGDVIHPGIVYLAGRDRHLIMYSPTQLGYSTNPREISYCPSVDVFFKSVAKNWRGSAVGILLTGMGRDGAQGLKALREAGHHTIAQDKGSSAIYGMPKAAAELNAAQEILPLNRIAARLSTIVCK